jgi:hypothetical protein
MKKSFIFFILLVITSGKFNAALDKGDVSLRLSESSINLDEQGLEESFFDSNSESSVFVKIEFDLDFISSFKRDQVFREKDCLDALVENNKEWAKFRGFSQKDSIEWFRRMIYLAIQTKELDISGFTSQ